MNLFMILYKFGEKCMLYQNKYVILQTEKQSKNMTPIYLKYSTKTPPKYPQSFTGKERDSETGFSYFGARYYDSDILTAWLSVDPMADKYPSLSPYNYCAWNPVKLVDPDGRMIGVIFFDCFSVCKITYLF